MCNERKEKNPMRVIDCKNPQCKEAITDIPYMIDNLCDDCKAHFAELEEYLKEMEIPYEIDKTIVRGLDYYKRTAFEIMIDNLCDDCKAHFAELEEYLKEMEIPYEIDKTIVRGLDYYKRTAFEIIAENIGAQSTVCGGGRYDGLVEQLGGPKGTSGKGTSGIGFALGAERLLLTLEDAGIEIENPQSTDIFIVTIGDEAKKKSFGLLKELRDNQAERLLLTLEDAGIEIENPQSTDIFIVTIGDEAKKKSFGLLKELRDNHISADKDHLSRSVKAQFKYSDKINAKFTIVIGDDELKNNEASLKNMATSEQHTVKLSELVKELKERL